MTLTKLNIEDLCRLVDDAGKAIMDIYSRDFATSLKDDSSPLTEADEAAHDVLMAGLKRLFPDHPVISEEGAELPYEVRSQWQELFMIDPLDGTKEFIKRNGEFTVNLAMIEAHEATFGIVHIPAKGISYVGCRDLGAWTWQNNTLTPLSAPKSQSNGSLYVAGSRSHRGESLDALLQTLQQSYDHVEMKPAGSALKFCLVADGDAQLYPRLGPTMEWDTAAGQAVVEAVGGLVYRTDTGERLRYNREDLLNPSFVVFAPGMATDLVANTLGFTPEL